MNLTETVALIEALKLAGVKKFKSGEHDIEFDASAPVSKPLVHKPVIPEAPVQANPEATQRAIDLINTLKMSPEDLANQIFPDGAI